jgi:hypothetical protein
LPSCGVHVSVTQATDVWAITHLCPSNGVGAIMIWTHWPEGKMVAGVDGNGMMS